MPFTPTVVQPDAPGRCYEGLDVDSDQGGLFPWKSERVPVEGRARQAYVDAGPRDAPLTFLLLHGNPTWGFLWRKFIERLSGRYRVIAPDHVGFGRSDKPSEPEYYSLERHIVNLEHVLRRADVQRVVPVVHDWGGPIGMGWATRHAERVAGVVVLNTWAFVREPEMRLPFWFHWLVGGKGGWKRSVAKNIFTETFLAKGGARKLSERELNAYRAPHATPADRVGIGMFPRMIPETADRQHPDWETLAHIEDRLGDLSRKPALIVWAKRDPAFKKPFLERWERLFLDVDGPHLLPEAKHYLQEDAPEAILEHIERWASEVAKTARKVAPATATTR